MKNRKREFHAIVPDSTFTFHLRNDVPPKKGDLSNDMPLHHNTRGATIVIMTIGKELTYGIARCEWIYQFNKKLARSVATGRAKQAFEKRQDRMNWYKQGLDELVPVGNEKDALYDLARSKAKVLVMKLNEYSEKLESEQFNREIRRIK